MKPNQPIELARSARRNATPLRGFASAELSVKHQGHSSKADIHVVGYDR